MKFISFIICLLGLGEILHAGGVGPTGVSDLDFLKQQQDILVATQNAISQVLRGDRNGISPIEATPEERNSIIYALIQNVHSDLRVNDMKFRMGIVADVAKTTRQGGDEHKKHIIIGVLGCFTGGNAEAIRTLIQGLDAQTLGGFEAPLKAMSIEQIENMLTTINFKDLYGFYKGFPSLKAEQVNKFMQLRSKFFTLGLMKGFGERKGAAYPERPRPPAPFPGGAPHYAPPAVPSGGVTGVGAGAAGTTGGLNLPVRPAPPAEPADSPLTAEEIRELNISALNSNTSLLFKIKKQYTVLNPEDEPAAKVEVLEILGSLSKEAANGTSLQKSIQKTIGQISGVVPAAPPATPGGAGATPRANIGGAPGAAGLTMFEQLALRYKERDRRREEAAAASVAQAGGDLETDEARAKDLDRIVAQNQAQNKAAAAAAAAGTLQGRLIDGMQTRFGHIQRRTSSRSSESSESSDSSDGWSDGDDESSSRKPTREQREEYDRLRAAAAAAEKRESAGGGPDSSTSASFPPSAGPGSVGRRESIAGFGASGGSSSDTIPPSSIGGSGTSSAASSDPIPPSSAADAGAAVTHQTIDVLKAKHPGFNLGDKSFKNNEARSFAITAAFGRNKIKKQDIADFIHYLEHTEIEESVISQVDKRDLISKLKLAIAQ